MASYWIRKRHKKRARRPDAFPALNYIRIRRSNFIFMNWGAILMYAGVPDPPGRADAVQKALSKSKMKKLAKQSSTGKSR